MSPLERYAAHARGKTREKIGKAQRDIELDFENNQGTYPLNKGRVTAAEVCRRAGIGMAVLQGAAHRDTTRREVNRWVARVNQRIVAGHRQIRRTVTDRADRWEALYKELQQGWAVAELEYIQGEARIAQLEEQLAQVRQELARARDERHVRQGEQLGLTCRRR